MKIGRVPLLKSQIKKLKPLLDEAKKINKPPFEHGFIIVGQVTIPDAVNNLKEPWLKVIMLTDKRARDAIACIDKQWKDEN